MSCADVKEHLVDFLYGQLSAAARAAFDEHVRGCAACRAEVASHEKVLGQARKALAGPLAQEPPPGVRAAVLAAARQATTAKARPAVREELGLFARFWRAPWLLPALGAVSVATVVFLVKVLKNPEVIPSQRAQPMDERALPAEPTTPPSEQATPMPAAAPTREEADDRAASGSSLQGSRRSSAGPERAHKAKARSAAAIGGLDGLASGGKAVERKYAEPPPARPTARPTSESDDLMRTLGKSERAPAPAAEPAAAAASKKGSSERAAEGTASGRRDYARPASAAHAPAAMAPALAAPPPPTRSTASAAVAGQPAAAPPARARLKQAEKATSELSGSAEDQTLSKVEREADKAPPSIDETVRRADRLFATQAWSAAADAYRDLLRRFPSHKDAAKWRDRINQAQIAEREQRKANEAKAAKAKAADAPRGAGE